MRRTMEITNLFNFDGTSNQVNRDVVYFIQRLNEKLDYKVAYWHIVDLAKKNSDAFDIVYRE